VSGTELTPPTGHIPEVPEHIAADADADPESVARTICLRLLTIGARTRSELAEALASKGVPDKAAASVLARLSDVGLIDDTSFAETFVHSRQQERGLARREIARQLRAKGVDDDIIQSAVYRIDADQEKAAAIRLAERRARSMAHLDAVTKARRLAGMLARKGYSPGLTYSVVRSVLGDSEDADSIRANLDMS
jgi:regulatory protein